MKKRIADIVTRFRAEGLGPVRAALQQVAASAKKTRAQTARVGSGMDRGVESSKRRVLRSFGEISRGGARAFRDVNRAATRAYTGMARGAASTAGAITGALGKISLNRYTLLGGAGILGGIGVGKALKAISPLFTGGLALGGAIGAGILSVLDANKILGLTESLGVGPEVAGQWQLMANRVGLSTDDIAGSLQGLKSQMIASLDPTSDAAKLFKRLGVSVKDGAGRLRSVSGVMFDLSDATSKLTDQQRSFALAEIFGEADAAKISELLRTLGTDREKLLAEFEKNKADGLFASAEDLKRIKEFRVSFLALIAPLKAFARELFLTFEPFFSKVLGNLEVLFRSPQERARIIQSWFVKPFQRGLQLLNDLLQVFVGFDLMAWIGGVDGTTPIINTWTISLKNFLVETWRVVKGLGALFIGLGAAILDIATLIDNLVERATGVRIEDWWNRSGTQDTADFFRDLGDIAANAFIGSLNAGMMRTGAGQWLAGIVNDTKSYLGQLGEPFLIVFDYITSAFEDLGRAGGLDDATTALGKFLIMMREAIGWVAQLVPAIADVFIVGKDAPAGFEFLDKIKSTFDYVLGVVKEVAGVLAPMFAQFDAYSREKFGLSGGASLILGKLGVDAIGKLATPATLAAGIFGGGGLVGSMLADWWNGPGPAVGPPDNGPSANLDAGTVKDKAAYDALLAREEADRQYRERASAEATDAVTGALLSGLKSITVDQIGAGPRMLPQIAAVLRQAIVDGFRMVSGSDAAMPEGQSTAAFVGDVLRSGTPAGVSQGVRALIDGGTGAGEAVKLAAVNATGTPVNLTINGVTKTGLFPDDDAASLQRAFDGGLGGY